MQECQSRASPRLSVGHASSVGVVIEPQPHDDGIVASGVCSRSCAACEPASGARYIPEMIRTTAAACILGVSTNTLRSWERRYGYPRPRRSSGGHRRYTLDEIQALRQTLAETQNVSSA